MSRITISIELAPAAHTNTVELLRQLRRVINRAGCPVIRFESHHGAATEQADAAYVPSRTRSTGATP